MVKSRGILVAHKSAELRDELSVLLHDAGYEVIPATAGREAVRSTVGLNPRMVIVQASLDEVSGYELPSRLQATGLDLPPIIILYDSQDELPDALPAGDVYCVFAEGLELHDLVQYVRLVMLAKEVAGEFGGNLDVMHGDLTRAPFGDLMAALQRNVISGRLDFSRSPEAGVSLDDGAVVDAWWGPVRGVKAFFRLAGLPSGGYSLRLAEFSGERTIDGFVGDLVVDAVEERLGFDEVMASLPSDEARPQVQVVQDLFNTQFSPVERKVLAMAQKLRSLGELVDAVDVSDFEVAKAIASLCDRGLLELKEPAGRVHVFTDSTADLLVSEARRLGIDVVAVSIIFGTEVFKDGIDLTPESYFKKLKDLQEPPITNPATKGEFIQAYQRVIASGDILGIYCSSKLSKSYDNALLAAQDGMQEFIQARRDAGISAEPMIHTVDSRQCSASLGMLTVFASRLLRHGLSSREVVHRLESIKTRLRTFLAVKSLEYLKRMGEMQGDSTKLEDDGVPGRFILALEDGALKLVDRLPPGPRTRSRLAELAATGLDLEQPVFVALVHASAPAEAAAMRPILHDRFRITELVEEQMGPAVTCHNGPGTLGVGVFQPTEDELELLRAEG